MVLSDQKNRVAVYDWVRGLAAIAVVLDHYHPFLYANFLFSWAVHAFVLVTLALQSGKKMSAKGLGRKLCYLIYIYAALLFLFHPVFASQGRGFRGDWLLLFLNPYHAFIKNPYFDHLWYIALHFQILVFLFVFQGFFKKLRAESVLLGSFIVSHLYFLWSHAVADSYYTIFLPSWLFVMAAGWYGFPRLVSWMQQHPEGRGKRCLAVLLLIVSSLVLPDLRGFLGSYESKTYALNTLFFFGVIFLVAEIYYLLVSRGFQWLIHGVSRVSRATLVLYIYHQGLWVLIHPETSAGRLLLAFAAVLSGTLLGLLLERLWGFVQTGFGAVLRGLSYFRFIPEKSAEN